MTVARWQATIQDDRSNILPGASVEVRSEATGALVPLFADRAGATPKSNPFAADGDGFAFFHAAGGAYRVTATSGASSRVWRYVGVGLGSEADTAFPGFDTATETAIADIADDINTSGKLAGRAIWDETNHRLMIASGPDADDAWHVADGSASVTPS